jgi:hypothetical protein
VSITDLENEREALGLQRDGRPISERALQAVPDAQEGLFDQVLDDPALEAALERRLKAQEDLKPKKRALKEADDAAKGIIAGLQLEDPEPGDDAQVFRCGRFRIKRSPRASMSVSFVTAPSVRTTISLLKD